ncbi:histone acetyltransferase [Malassezia sp. CBS 17886]|nr:histone acetyltransferase [Malassezia sp. CBS 17886]
MASPPAAAAHMRTSADASLLAPRAFPCWVHVLQGGSAREPSACLAWSADGQVAVVATDAIHILTPCIGYAPDLCADAAGIVHADADAPLVAPGARDQLAHFATAIPARPDTERTAADDAGDEVATASVSPPVLSGAWCAAAWSPRGLGPLGSCVLATVNARGSLRVYETQNCVHGPWVASAHGSVDAAAPAPRPPPTDLAAQFAAQYLAVAWSHPARSPSPPALLAAGTRAGAVHLFRAHPGAPLQLAADATFDSPVQHLAWSRWDAHGNALIAVHTTRAIHVMAARADGALHDGPFPGAPRAWEMHGRSVSALRWAHGAADGCAATAASAAPSATLCFATAAAEHAWHLHTDTKRTFALHDTTGHAAGVVPGDAADAADAPAAGVSAHDDWSLWTADGHPAAAPAPPGDADAAMQRSLARLQTLWGLAGYPGDGGPQVALLAALATADEPASWRYRVTRRLAYTLWTPFVPGWTLGADARARLWRLAPPADEARPPLAAWRPFLVACVLCGAQAQLLTEVAARLQEERAAPLLARFAAAVQDDDDGALAACATAARQLYAARLWIHRLARAAGVEVPAPLPAVPWLTACLQAVLSTGVGHARERGTERPAAAPAGARPAAALRCLLSQMPAVPHAERVAAALRRRIPDASQRVVEHCPACSENVPFSVEAYAKCTSGHVFERCVVSWAVLETDKVVLCSGCGRCALHRVAGGEGCPQCGHQWVG